MSDELALAINRLDEFRNRMRGPQKAQTVMTDGGIEFSRCDLDRLRRDCMRKTATHLEKMMCTEITYAFNSADAVECERYERDLIELNRLRRDVNIETSIDDAHRCGYKNDDTYVVINVECAHVPNGVPTTKSTIVAGPFDSLRSAVVEMYNVYDTGEYKHLRLGKKVTNA